MAAIRFRLSYGAATAAAFLCLLSFGASAAPFDEDGLTSIPRAIPRPKAPPAAKDAEAPRGKNEGGTRAEAPKDAAKEAAPGAFSPPAPQYQGFSDVKETLASRCVERFAAITPANRRQLGLANATQDEFCGCILRNSESMATQSLYDDLNRNPQGVGGRLDSLSDMAANVCITSFKSGRHGG